MIPDAKSQGKTQGEQGAPKLPPVENQKELGVQNDPPWWILATVLLLAIILLAVYGFSVGSHVALVVELMVGVAALSVGLFLGFLFGIPRGQAPTSSDNGGDNGATQVRGLGYVPSTNLEQVADWLTKILVGVGLVEFGTLLKALSNLGAFVADSLGSPRGANLVSQLVVIAFSSVGFLASFLWTRVYYGAIQFNTDAGIWRQLKSLVEKSEERSQTAITLAKSVASGELTQPGSALKGVTPDAAPLETTQLMQGDAPHQQPQAELSEIESAIDAKIDLFRKAPPAFDSDPVGDLFSERSEGNGRRLIGRVDLELEDALVLVVRVEGLAGNPALSGDAIFLLHPTLENPVRRVPCESNSAEVKFYTQGWFHLAAIVDGKKTVLVLDLRQVPRIPKWFTEA